MINSETTITDNSHLTEMISRLKTLDGQKVSAGLFGGFAGKKAMWNEYGTSRGIPARPFLRNTLYENERRWGSLVGSKVVLVMNGSNPDELLSFMGINMVSSIRKTINSGGFAPLSTSTISKKGSSKALVDTGDMYGSITWKKG